MGWGQLNKHCLNLLLISKSGDDYCCSLQFVIGGADIPVVLLVGDTRRDSGRERKTDHPFLHLWCESDKVGDAIIGPSLRLMLSVSPELFVQKLVH